MAYSFRAYYPYYKRNLKLAFPVMLTQFGAALVGLADSIMVGHYGTTDLAAVSFSNALFFTVMVFAMGSLMGITPLVGNVHGRLEKLLKEGTTDEEIAHKHEQITSYLTNGLVFTVLMSILSLALSGRVRTRTRSRHLRTALLHPHRALYRAISAVYVQQTIPRRTRQHDHRHAHHHRL